jgi:hypothetical protein
MLMELSRTGVAALMEMNTGQWKQTLYLQFGCDLHHSKGEK